MKRDLAPISVSGGAGGARSGAGRPAVKAVVEDFPVADIRDWWWSLALEALRRGDAAGKAPVRLRLGPQPEDAVEVTTTPGGACPKHAWFVCPGCRGRAAKLYLREDKHLCRRCHGLAYRSQRVSLYARAGALEAKTVAKLAQGHARPPRMHRTTYDRLLVTLVMVGNMRARSVARLGGSQAERELLREVARCLRSAIAAARHKATRPPPSSDELRQRLLSVATM